MSKRDHSFLNKIKTITFGTGAKKPAKKKFNETEAIKQIADQEEPGYDHKVQIMGKLPLACDDCGAKAVGVLAHVTRTRKDNPNERSLSA